MALRKFTPDPDLFDPEDPEGWYGTWEHDDGSKLYGQGSEEMGRPLLDAGDDDPRTAEFSPADAREWAASGGQQLPRAEDETEQRLDAPPPLQQPKPQQPAATAPAAAPVNPAIADPAAPADGGWDDDVPPQVAGSLRQQAAAAGLSPDALAAVIKHESGWNPSIGSQGDAGGDTHAGLIQFSKNLWPGVAAAAGRPDVSFEEMRSMSAEDQIPFVVAYYKGKGLTPDSAPGDYKLATYKPKYLKEGDDFVLDDAASTKGVKVKPGTARLDRNGDGIINSYEQNAGLDTNKDGKITNGEVRGGASAAAAPRGAQAPGAPPLGGGLPSSFNGLPAAAAEVQGVPLTPDQIAQRQKDVGQRYAVQAAAQQQGLAQRVQGRQEVMNQWQAESEKQATDAATQEQTHQRAQAEAEQKIQNEVNKPIQTVDPGRLIKNMSTGSKVLGGIAILMSELGRAAMGLAGMDGGPNMALNIIMKRIDSDVDAQKENIHNEAQASSNRVAFWTRKLGNAEDGISAARAEAHQAAGMKLQTAAMGSDIADVKAQGTEMAAQLFGNAQQEIQNITDREANRLTLRYAVPPPPKGAKEKTLADSIESAKKARQELLLAGKSPEETKQILADNGIPYIEGDTVAQDTARQGVERSQDEDTSKELAPIALAEDRWREALGQLDKLEAHPLVRNKGFKPGGFVEGVTSTWPGFPSVDEQNGFDQAITGATNAQIAALGRASDSDEDRIKHETIGGGDLKSYRRGIMSQLHKLERQRQIVTGRRQGAAGRVENREQADAMPKVTGKVPRAGASGSY
jgi:hypothetical protein